MTSNTFDRSFGGLSDRDLIAETRRVVEQEHHATSRVIAALMELDARRLYLAEGYSSLFIFCTQALRFSEHAAYGRIERISRFTITQAF